MVFNEGGRSRGSSSGPGPDSGGGFSAREFISAGLITALDMENTRVSKQKCLGFGLKKREDNNKTNCLRGGEF